MKTDLVVVRGDYRNSCLYSSRKFPARQKEAVVSSRNAICSYLFLFLLFTLQSRAQNSFLVSGVVQDGSGAVIPGAQVTLRQPHSATVLSATSDAEGIFRIPANSIGEYRLEVCSTGFKAYTQQISISAGEPSPTLSIALAIDGNTQTVEVTADALAAETTSTQLGESLDTKKIESVPLNGRSFTDLMAVQPRIVPQNTAQPGAVVMTGVASTPPPGDATTRSLQRLPCEWQRCRGRREHGHVHRA